jgi:hypothetical protein
MRKRVSISAGLPETLNVFLIGDLFKITSESICELQRLTDERWNKKALISTATWMHCCNERANRLLVYGPLFLLVHEAKILFMPSGCEKFMPYLF